ncbi:MAG: LD-carboxypeptidase [Patescibacteria group bacterium]
MKTIGIIAPSRHLGEYKDIFNFGVDRLRREGFNIVMAPNVYEVDNNSAGSIEQRIAGLDQILLNDDIDVVMCTLGGDSANHLLDRIDWSVYSKLNKILIGYSDVTHLLLAFQKKTDLKLYYGPHIKDISSLTNESFGVLTTFIDTGGLLWPDDFQVVRSGKVIGELYGGNLFVVNNMLATDYVDDFSGRVLFWEDVDDGLSAVEYQLYQMRLHGVFSRIKGMMVGNVVGDDIDNNNLAEIILDAARGFDFPIVKVDWFGHEVNDFRVVPYGGKVMIDIVEDKLELM